MVVVRSVIELSDHGDTSLDPVGFVYAQLHWQHNHRHEVGRVPGRQKHPGPGLRPVDRTEVDVLLDRLAGTGFDRFLLRAEPDERQRVVVDLGQRLGQEFRLRVPSRALEVDSADEDGERRRLLRLGLGGVDQLEVELDLLKKKGTLGCLNV